MSTRQPIKACFFRMFFVLLLLSSFVIDGCGSRNYKDLNNDGSVSCAIMTTADIQSVITPCKAEIDGRDIVVGGFERIAAVARRVRGEVDASLLVSTGDDLFGPLYSLMKGKPEITGMNLTGYDVVCPGNHEFDFGASLYKTAIANAGFPIVCANLHFDDRKLSSEITPTCIKEIKGIKVGFFGLMTPNFLRVCNPGPGVKIDEDIVPIARKMVGELKAGGCGLIVALTHIGEDEDRMLARSVEGIDIIVGGHSHTYVYETVNNTVIINDGSRAQYLGVLRFTYENGRVKDPYWKLVLLDSTVGADSGIKNKMSEFMNTYEKGLKKVIGRSTVDLDARKSVVRDKESVIGNMITDAFLYWFGDVDVAFINGGAIRGDEIFPAGDLTYETVNAILPFRDELVKVRLTGAQLKQVLEISASSIGPEKCASLCVNATRISSGGFLQSGGLKVVYNTSADPFCAVYNGKDVTKIVNPGSRVTSVEVLKNGTWKPVEDNVTYTVIINKWLAGGGNGYYVFRNESIPKDDTTVIDVDVLINYIQKNTPLTPVLEGRIKRLTDS